MSEMKIGKPSAQNHVLPKMDTQAMRALMFTSELASKVAGDAFQPAQIPRAVNDGAFKMDRYNVTAKAPKNSSETEQLANKFFDKFDL